MHVNNNGYRRRPRKRITGRFYAFLTVMVMLVVFVCVFISTRRGGNSTNPNVIAPMPQSTPYLVTAQPTPQPVAVVPAPQTQSDTGAVPVQDMEAPPSAASPADTGSASASGSTGAAGTTGAASSGLTSIADLYAQEEVDAPVDAADTVQVSANDLSVTEGLPSEWQNFLLLGTDTRNLNSVNRTDTIIIASVNANSGKIRLVSIMRDLAVPFTNSQGVTKEVKINSLIGRGGVNRVMKTINELFDMNITQYVMVNFASFQKVVDIIGGVEMDITQEEMKEINSSLGEMAKVAGYDQDWYLENKDSLALQTWGAQTHLTGIQALGYVRIRHVGAGDYRRTERQRDLLDAILRKIKNDANILQIMQLFTSMWGEFTTNVDLGTAVGLATTVLKNGAVKINDSWRIPGTSTSFKGETRSSLGYALYECDFEANAALLHQFIYENNA